MMTTATQPKLSAALEKSLVSSLATCIADDIRAQPKLYACHSFADLHGVCDANMLGGQALVFHWLDADQSHRIIGAAQDIVDGWLKLTPEEREPAYERGMV